MSYLLPFKFGAAPDALQPQDWGMGEPVIEVRYGSAADRPIRAQGDMASLGQYVVQSMEDPPGTRSPENSPIPLPTGYDTGSIIIYINQQEVVQGQGAKIWINFGTSTVPRWVLAT